MVMVVAHVIEQASANSRPWIIAGVVGLLVAVLIRFFVRRFGVSSKTKQVLTIIAVLSASAGVTLAVAGMVVNLPPAENTDEFYPNLHQPPQPKVNK
jgi:ABC-type uncharacterized transport system permease subunit